MRGLAQNIATFVVAALTLTAALAWNGAIRSFFEARPALRARGPWVYALAVTLIALLCVGVLTHLTGTAKKEDD